MKVQRIRVRDSDLPEKHHQPRHAPPKGLDRRGRDGNRGSGIED